jgi:DNA repair protein RecO (recombination protein O)
MPVFEDEAIVLRQYSLSDSDRILVLITREHGKVRAVAKGVKKPKSQIAGCVEPLCHIRIEFYAREGSDLNQVRRAELIHSYLGRAQSLKYLYAYSYFAEICNEIIQDNQVNYPLFRLLLACLRAGDSQGISRSLLRYFEIWCLKLSGLFPNYAYCSDCGKCVKDEGFFVWPEAGQARCNACALGRGLRINASASAFLARMAWQSPEQFVAEAVAEEAVRETECLAQRLLGFHLEKQLKSYQILKEALPGL